tara:strand:+ start:28 stop:1404 length:1377 start_codon:yes stop_codon:yes gene_type:complete
MNNMEDSNSSIYVQAKIEYTKQLINNIQSHMFDGVKSIYDDSKDLYNKNSSSSQLFIFRTLLEKVPEWNNEMVVNETDRIIEYSKCDYLEDLLTAVFISHTKILMSIGSNNTDRINLTVPKLSNFIHKCYINIARSLWKNPLLFSENISGLEYQRNLNTIESIISDGIENTIRFSLPVKDIIKGQLDLQEKQEKEEKQDDNTLLLNKLKELLNLKDDSESVDESPKEVVEGNTNSKPIIEITKEPELQEEISKLKEELTLSDSEIKQNDINSGYDSPGEETIDRNCTNLEINDIEEVVVDNNKYDNPEIIDAEKENGELYDKLVKIKQDNEDNEIVSGDVVVSKISDNPIKVDELPIEEPIENIDLPELSSEEKLKQELKDRNYDDRIEDITDKENNELKSIKTSIEDVVIIEDKPKKDDDKETVDLFMDDLQKMDKKEEITMDKINENDYILFDDLK